MSPWTNFPQGVSVTTATGTVDGRVNATSISVTENSIIGEVVTVTVTIPSASTAQEVYSACPIAGHVIEAAVVSGVTVAVTTLHTLLVNSAGTTITTITNASGTQGLVTSATIGTGTSVAVTTADSLHFRRAVSGTAGNTFMTCVIARTA